MPKTTTVNEAERTSDWLRYRLLLGVLAVVLVADQATKLAVLRTIPEQTYHFDGVSPEPIPVIDGFFYLVHIWNPGAAWGLFSGYGTALAILAVLTLAGIYWFRKALLLHTVYMQVAFGLLCGGIIGNLIDRLRLDHVVDFLDFHLPIYGRWPAFNIADCGISIGVAMYILASIYELVMPTKPAEDPAGEPANTPAEPKPPADRPE